MNNPLRSRVLRIAGVRVVVGVREPGHGSRSAGWMDMTPDARESAIAAARRDLAANPQLSVYAAERNHGIPRCYLADRLRAETRRAAYEGAAIEYARTGNLSAASFRYGLCPRDLTGYLARRAAK